MTPFPSRKRTALLAAALLTPGAGFGADCAPPPQLQAQLRAHPTAENYAAAGEYFGDKGEHRCAAQALAAALKLQPRSSKFSYLLGLNLYAEGEAEPATEALRQSIQLNPQSLQAHLLLAEVLENLNRQTEAAAEWRAALEIDSTSKLALDGIAKFLLASNDYSAVIRLLRPARRDENLSLDLAVAYERAGKVEEALSTLKQDYSAAPDSLKLADALSLAYLRVGQHQAAAALMEKQYNLHPEDLETEIDYLRVLVIDEDREKARPLAKTVLDRVPHDFNALYLGGMQERLDGDFAAAKDHLAEAASLNPAHANCRYVLGLALARLHQPDEARGQFEKALELGWSGPEIHYELAGAYRALGDTEKAAQQMKLYQEASRAKEERTLAVNKLAQADQELQAGERKAAITHYREAVDAWPANPNLPYKLALALDADGNLPEERAALDQALRIDSKFPPAQKQLGSLATRSGDQAEAERHFRLAVQGDPALADAWAGLASTLAAESKLAEAREAADRALSLDPDNVQAQAIKRDLDRKTHDSAAKANP